MERALRVLTGYRASCPAAQARPRRTSRRSRGRRGSRRPRKRGGPSWLPPNLFGIGPARRQPVAGSDTGRDDHLFTAPTCDVNVLFVEQRSSELVDDRSAIALEHRFGGREKNGGHAVGRNTS